MALLTTTERRWGRLVRTAEELERIDAMLNDDSVVFAGRVKTNTMHMVVGAAKAVASRTRSVCGKEVGNTYRAINQYDKVCKFCERGQKATGFTKHNQPRECMSCGKMFADNASRDNTSETCGACYEEAGRENAHQDGLHADERDEDCPMCKDEIAAEAQEALAASQAVDAAESARETEAAVHESEHQDIVASGCRHCAERLQGATVADPLDDAAEQAQYDAETDQQEREDARFERVRKALLVERAESRIKGRLADIAARLRGMADHVERAEETILRERGEGDTFQATDVATNLLTDLMRLMSNASVDEIVRDAARLERARREGR